MDERTSIEWWTHKRLKTEWTMDEQTMGEQMMDKQTMDKQTMDERTWGERTMDEWTMHEQTMDERTMDERTMDRRTNDGWTDDGRANDGRAKDNKRSDKRTSMELKKGPINKPMNEWQTNYKWTMNERWMTKVRYEVPTTENKSPKMYYIQKSRCFLNLPNLLWDFEIFTSFSRNLTFSVYRKSVLHFYTLTYLLTVYLNLWEQSLHSYYCLAVSQLDRKTIF